MSIKVTFIGAGSIGFTRGLVSDLLSVPEFCDINIAFTDNNENNLDMVTKLCQRDINENNLSIKIQSTTDRREALKDANYVFNMVRVGGLEAFTTDIDIPLKYGIDQCVGDTLCAGGIMYGQRGIPVILDFCKDIREVCSENCILLNYSNPNAMITWAANMYGKVKTIGLCHGVTNTIYQISKALEVPENELDIVCAGINHQTWFIKVNFKGKDMIPKLLEAYENHAEFSKTEKVRIDIMKHFGYYSTESNGHLSEYLAWYRKRPEEIKDWIDMGEWINGETGGYLRYSTEGRTWFETDFPNWLNEPARKYNPSTRSKEHGSYIVESLETSRTYRGHFNVENNGLISNLPDDCIVELPCYVDGAGIQPTQIGELPLGCAGICNQSVTVQRLSVEAAVKGNIKLLRQAFMLDPLTGAVCNTREICQLVDEMLISQENWLPNYETEIKDAKQRLSKVNIDYKNPNNRGVARLKIKSAEELAKERRVEN